VPQHALIIPIAHCGALAGGSPALRAEVERFKAALARMFAADGGRGMVAFERVLHARRGETPQHTHVQVVPLPAALVAGARDQLVMEGTFRYVPLAELPRAAAAAATDDALAAAVTLPAPLEGSVPELTSSTGTVEYFYIEAPLGGPSGGPVSASGAGPTGEDAGGAAAGGADAGGADTRRPPYARLLHVVPPGTKHPVQFGRELVCRLLCAPDRLSWKACALPHDEEAALAERFRAAFAPVDFTAEL
jgi:hypothetical protein